MTTAPALHSIAPALYSIFIAPAARQPMTPLASANLEAGRGIVGDRYHARKGSFSRWPGSVREISLISLETLLDVLAKTNIDLTAGQHRRNLVTQHLDLASLIDQTFRIGPAILRGLRPCPPCRYLDRLTSPGTHDALLRRGGLRAQILLSGTITPGDPIQPTPWHTPIPPQKPRRQRPSLPPPIPPAQAF